MPNFNFDCQSIWMTDCLIRVYLVFVQMLSYPHQAANTIHCDNEVLVLGQRQRRWPNTKTPLAEHFLFAGKEALTYFTQHRIKAIHVLYLMQRSFFITFDIDGITIT